MQASLHGSNEGGRLHSVGEHEEDDWPEKGRTRWPLGGNSRTYVLRRKCRTADLSTPPLTDNFEEYWRVASKVTPTTAPTRPQSPPPGNSTSLHTRPPSADPNTGSAPDRDGAYNVRSVPVRIYLPEGPVLQDLVPPSLDDGAHPFHLPSVPSHPLYHRW